jgi:oligoendopeptidase F
MSANRRVAVAADQQQQIVQLQQAIVHITDQQTTLLQLIQDIKDNLPDRVIRRAEQQLSDALAGKDAVLDAEDQQQLQQLNAGQGGAPDNLQDRLNQSMINANISMAQGASFNAQHMVVFPFDKMGNKDTVM